MKRMLLLLTIFIASLALAQSPKPQGAVLEKIAAGFSQPEGPVWWNSIPNSTGSDTAGLLFSDIQKNIIYKWTPNDSIKIFMQHSDSSNGLTLDRQGRLILTQMELQRVSRREVDGTITPLASTYTGKRFNSPNDVVVKSDGAIFFTDPPFNVPTGKGELKIAGIYRISPYGSLQILDSSLAYPNGISFSPDEKKLYVNESAQDKIYVWDVVNDSTIANKKLFSQIPLQGYADGMKVDPQGNIYIAGPKAVWIYSPGGAFLDTIKVPETPSNCNWGDADRKTLYITAGHSLYRIRLAQTSGINNQGYLQNGKAQQTIKSFKLYNNYPNPFNPSTVINYEIASINGGQNLSSMHVTLIIYDSLGKRVATLVNNDQGPGLYSYTFSTEEHPLTSGTYFYRLTANGSSQTKKMVLAK